MSYLCLMANPNGAVVAGDTAGLPVSPRENANGRCHAIPERRLIFALAGLHSWQRKPISHIVRSHLSPEGKLADQVEALGKALAPYTVTSLPDGSGYGITLFLAAREKGVTQVWSLEALNGSCTASRWALQGDDALLLVSGGQLSLEEDSIRALSFLSLRNLARLQVRQAMEAHKNDPSSPAAGGKITTYGLRARTH